MPVTPGPTPIATTGMAGKVKPDGSTVTVAADGTISAASAAPTGAAGGDLTGTYPNPTVPGLATKATVRSVGATVTAAGALAANAHTPADVSGGGFTLTLPTGQPAGAVISVEKTDSSTNAVTVSGNLRGQAAQTIQLILQRAAIDLIADASGSWWPFAGHHTLSSLDARYAAGNDTRIVNAAETNGANTFTGNQTAPALIASGLTGAVAGSRYVGATASGAPASGTFAIGDFVIDQTATIFVCTAAGTPGTWAKVLGQDHSNRHLPGQGDDLYLNYGHMPNPTTAAGAGRLEVNNPGLWMNGGTGTISTGFMFASEFTAPASETLANLQLFVVTSAVVGGGSISHAQIVLCSVSGTTYSVIGTTNDDSTILTGNGLISKSITGGSGALTKGSRYAFGILAVYSGLTTSPSGTALNPSSGFSTRSGYPTISSQAGSITTIATAGTTTYTVVTSTRYFWFGATN